MRPDAVVSTAVIVTLLAVIALSWRGLQNPDPYEPLVVRELGSAWDSTTIRAPLPIASANAAPARKEALGATLLFEFDRAGLEPSEAAKLDKLVETLRLQGARQLQTVGHADRIGSAAYNLRLSERRADAVKAYLVERQVDAAMVQTRARGETEPMSGDACIDMGAESARNDALVECLHLDRRVEVRAIGETP